MNEPKKNIGKELREKYGVFGKFSIIQIVGLILVLALIVTVVYRFF